MGSVTIPADLPSASLPTCLPTLLGLAQPSAWGGLGLSSSSCPQPETVGRQCITCGLTKETVCLVPYAPPLALRTNCGCSLSSLTQARGCSLQTQGWHTGVCAIFTELS